MTSSLKGILLQYGGFLVAMLAVAITVVSPRSEALFGISTTTCLLIGALSLFLFSLSSSFELVLLSRIGIRFVSPNDARFDMYIVQKPTGGKLTNQQQPRHKKTTTTGIAVAFVSLPLHEMRPYQDKRSMTTEKAAAEQHMKDLAEQEKQFKEGKKKK